MKNFFLLIGFVGISLGMQKDSASIQQEHANTDELIGCFYGEGAINTMERYNRLNEKLQTMSPNVKNQKGHFPLFVATEKDDVLAIRLLLKYGAEINMQDNKGRTALHESARAKFPKPLLMNDATIARGTLTLPNGEQVFDFTVFTSTTQAIEPLLKCGADVTVQDNKGFTALHKAAASNDYKSVKLLLDYKADPNARTNDGKTAYDITRNDAIKELLLKVMSEKKK
jgi:hypothetical protein